MNRILDSTLPFAALAYFAAIRMCSQLTLHKLPPEFASTVYEPVDLEGHTEHYVSHHTPLSLAQQQCKARYNSLRGTRLFNNSYLCGAAKAFYSRRTDNSS